MTMSLTANASQATQIEQVRAVAEVLAFMQAAQDRPRDEDRALTRFLSACARPAFAEKAFFRFSRGGQQVTGPTIEFAEEAARCWGNMLHGTSELDRRPGMSEMVAFAWDAETNTTRRQTFFSPHVGYADSPKFNQDGTRALARLLEVPRDIREGNQSTASRVEREMVLAVLPSWFVEAGIAACYATLKGQSTKPIDDRRRAATAMFESDFGVRREQLIEKVGVPADRWVEADLATLAVIHRRLVRGETTVEAEFGRSQPRAGQATVTGDDLATAQPVDTPPVDPAGSGPADQRGRNAVFARLNELGMTGRGGADRSRRLRLLELLTGETLTTQNDLTATGAEVARAALAGMTGDDVARLLAEDEQERAADAAAGEQA